MYDHELYDEMRKIDGKIKVCFMTATYLNYEALRDAFPTIEIECYIQKPVECRIGTIIVLAVLFSVIIIINYMLKI
jgi:hypothetical protein